MDIQPSCSPGLYGVKSIVPGCIKVAWQVTPLLSMETTNTENTVTPYDRDNYQLHASIFHPTPHHLICIFAINEQETVSCACEESAAVKVTAVVTAERHCPLPHSTHVCCLLSINVEWKSGNVTGCLFPAWRNSLRYHCFIHTSTTDTGLSSCHSAAICYGYEI